MAALSPLLSSFIPLSSLPLCFVALFSNITHLTQPPPVTVEETEGGEGKRGYVVDARTHLRTCINALIRTNTHPRALITCVYKRYIIYTYIYFFLPSESYYSFEAPRPRTNSTETTKDTSLKAFLSTNTRQNNNYS